MGSHGGCRYPSTYLGAAQGRLYEARRKRIVHLQLDVSRSRWQKDLILAVQDSQVRVCPVQWLKTQPPFVPGQLAQPYRELDGSNSLIYRLRNELQMDCKGLWRPYDLNLRSPNGDYRNIDESFSKRMKGMREFKMFNRIPNG